MRLCLLLMLLVCPRLIFAGPNRVAISKLIEEMIHRSTLAEPGGRPFYLKATITDKDNPQSEVTGTVEEYWVSPSKWRRVIKLHDFSQTRVVNGDLVYEDNNGDYFPVIAETLATEVVDPLPKSAVDLIDQLGLMGAEPGSGIGQCMAEKYFNDEEGKETRVLLAYDCKSGLLIYLWSPTCCYGVMTDYRKFHNKVVAYATKDNPINIHIDALRDLENPDESLFAISQSTPLEKRITNEKMSETKVRNLIVQRTDIEWPAEDHKTKEKSMTVNLVIGRNGHVNEARTYSPVDNIVKEAVFSAVKKWTFQPQNVDGVPAQVETSVIIPFPDKLQTVVTGQPDVRSIFEKVRSASNLRLEGAPGFYLKASFRSGDGSASGTYQETWLSPKKWRREVNLNGASVVEMQTEEAYYRIFPGKYAPRLADDLLDALSFALPGDNGSDFHDADWGATTTKLGDVPMLRLSAGYIAPNGRPDAFTRMFFVEDAKGLIRGRYNNATLAIFNDLQPFTGKMIARKITIVENAIKNLEVKIDTLQSAAKVSDDVFKLAGAKPIFTENEDEQDRRFTPAQAIYTVKPSLAGWHGKLTCSLSIDQHGHVRQVEVKGSTDQAVIANVREALIQWEYTPSTMNGHPAIGFATVNVE